MGAEESGTTEGCTPGYWKNHPESWLETPTDTVPVYTPSTPLNTISAGFDTYLPGFTFGAALEGGGGKGVTGAAQILARAATAAWLDARSRSPSPTGASSPVKAASTASTTW